MASEAAQRAAKRVAGSMSTNISSEARKLKEEWLAKMVHEEMKPLLRAYHLLKQLFEESVGDEDMTRYREWRRLDEEVS